ncbi:MAG TPA: phosphosulfolactate synthase [Acidimicrobiales bacterium]|nr:phosphosulfolactate synthase [Acidimicrobiales bacterium]
MDSIFLDLPHREPKPRRRGLTMAIDNGIPHGAFADAVASTAEYIDVVKFGWGTALVTPDIEDKLDLLKSYRIGYYFGGTLFEKFVHQNRFESFLTLCRLCDCRHVEISNGTIEMSPADKRNYISRCAEEFTVFSEVGFKDSRRSSELTAEQLVRAVVADLDAGASMVITEARESGRSGICRPDGTPREDLVDALLSSGVDPDRILFEAPTKDLQTHFIKLLGTNVNLGNISPTDVIGLETLRLGLRSDTLTQFEEARSHA